MQASTKETAEVPSSDSAPKYRYQFFQTQAGVEVAVLAKNLTDDRVNVTFEEQRLGIVILDETGKQVTSLLHSSWRER